MKTSEKQQNCNMWTSLVEDSHVKILALRGKVKVLEEKGLDYGVKCLELYGKLDLNTSSLKTAQCSLFEDSKESYATFPKSGMMRNGNVYRIPLLDSPIGEKECTYVRTPTKTDGLRYRFSLTSLSKKGSRSIGNLAECLAVNFGVKITPSFCEWIMGFPIMYTELKQSEMP